MPDDARQVTIPQGSPAVSLAAFQLAQRLTAFLIESGLLPAKQAIRMVRDAAQTELKTADDNPQPASDAAAHILEQFARALEQTHLKK